MTKTQFRLKRYKIHESSLRTLLRRMGVFGFHNKFRARKVIVFSRLTLAQLWELYEEAEQRYNTQIRNLHPDLSGSDTTEACADLNETWSRIKELFKRKYNICRDV